MTLEMSTPHAIGSEQSFSQSKDQFSAFALLFRGNNPLRPSARYHPLTTKQIKRLANIGITVQEGDTYVGGLVTLKPKVNFTLDLVAFKDFISKKITLLFSDKDFRKLILYYIYLHNLIYLKPQRNSYSYYPFHELYECKQAIGYLLLPPKFLSYLKNPNGFIQTTLYRIGNYAVSIIPELNPMFYSDLEDDNQNLVTLLVSGELIAPLTTSLKDRFSDEEYPSETNYPSPTQTRKFNQYQAIKSKARLALEIYEEISPKLPNMSKVEKIKTLARIRSLRPPMRTLKAHYRAKGDTPQVVNLLVTPEKYPDLPLVWLTKRQSQVLVDVVNGKGHLHSEFIYNGFKSR